MAFDDAFDDLLAANEAYARDFLHKGLEGRAAKGVAIITCMDSRIEPLAMLGLQPGDAKILRNAGGRVTADVLATLVVARFMLGVERAMVIQHTRCRMASGSEEDLHEAIRRAGGSDTRDLRFLVTNDQEAAVRSDVERVRAWPRLPGLMSGGFISDVDTGRLTRVI